MKPAPPVTRAFMRRREATLRRLNVLGSPLRFFLRHPRAVLHQRFVVHDSKLAHKWLDGLRGVEIGGAAHNDFHLDTINVDRYREMDTVYKQAELRQTGRAMPVDVVAPGDDLPFEDDSHDFVLASHVIEHIPDPVKALREWTRVARKFVFLVVPHRDRTFDRDRELTPVAELLARHEDGFSSDEDQHWSVWTLESFLELCEALGIRVLDKLDPDDKTGNAFMVVLDASEPWQAYSSPSKE
jgi:SAM-dependent methyltransferase